MITAKKVRGRDKDGAPGRGIIGIIVRGRLQLHPTSTEFSGGETTNPAESDYMIPHTLMLSVVLGCIIIVHIILLFIIQ
jgi:hypothetical protein